MGSRAEQELDEFLDAQPSWLRKILMEDPSFTAEELRALSESDWFQNGGVIEEKFLALLARCPSRLRQYRKLRKKRAAQLALIGIPSGQPGRPKKDALAIEAEKLHRELRSYARTAAALNRKYGPRTTTAEAIRKLIASRKLPEKT